MSQRDIRHLLLLILVAFCVVIGSHTLKEQAMLLHLNDAKISAPKYRAMTLNKELIDYMKERQTPGEIVAIYLTETVLKEHRFSYEYNKDTFFALGNRYKDYTQWREFEQWTKSIWDEVQYFPVPEAKNHVAAKVSYSDSWMAERKYKEGHLHEGTDIMAKKNIPGYYPVISMTDGTVTQKGWLEKGGYRIGVQTKSGAYFYYAHLDSYGEAKLGDSVRAGDILGYMGDSGYGEEGTTGQFPVHLHIGIYLYPYGKETSINPYWVLRYVEDRRLKCIYS